MAQNLTRVNNNHQKKSFSTAHFNLDYTDLTADSGTGSILMVMPKDCIIIHIGIIEETPANVGANATLTVNGDNVAVDGPIDSSNIFTIAPVHHDGGDLILKQGSTPPTQGTFSLFILYLEHAKNTGEFTNFSAN